MPARTSTVKSKHAANGSGIRNSKTSSKSFSKANKPGGDGVVKARSEKSKKTMSQGVSFKQQSKKGPGGQNVGGTGLAKLKKKRRVYTEKELGIQELNCITPVGVEQPKGKKKGKVFVDDRESMLTLLALVHAEKDGQIESKMMKARQMEEIREARKNEAESKFEARKAKLDETKEGLRKKRKRSTGAGGSGGDGGDGGDVRGTKPLKLKKKTVSFA